MNVTSYLKVNYCCSLATRKDLCLAARHRTEKAVWCILLQLEKKRRSKKYEIHLKQDKKKKKQMPLQECCTSHIASHHFSSAESTSGESRTSTFEDWPP